MAQQQDSILALERAQRYLGTAYVKLSQITQFDDCQPALQPNSHRVDTLEKKFRRAAVEDHKNENHLNAAVRTQGLDRALQVQQLSRGAFKEQSPNPINRARLEFKDGELLFLGGRSRVLAARNIPPWDRWWPVDLYHEDISEGLRRQLRDNHVIQAPISDGEVFLTRHRYKQAGDFGSMTRWGAYLSETKEKNLSRVADTEFGIVLSSLCMIPALWQDGVYLGVLHKMRSLHANSEYVHYLVEIQKCFGEALEQSPAHMARLTASDIETLQCTAPGSSEDDRKTLEGLVQGGKLLKAFDGNEQRVIYDHLCSRPFMIPTLFTFFQDIHIINQCAPMIAKLIDKSRLVPESGSREPDIKASMRYMFERKGGTEYSDNFEVEVSENRTRAVTATSGLRFELAYRQLWLYAIRHFLRPDHRKHRKIRFFIDEEGETKMLAAFASKLHFSSNSITHLLSCGMPQSRTRVILDEGAGTRYAKESERYGIPHPASWQLDRQLLYLDRIYSSPECHDGITTFFVFQSVFYHFFGYPDGFTVARMTSEQQDPPPSAESTLNENHSEPEPTRQTNPNFSDQGATNIMSENDWPSNNPPPSAEATADEAFDRQDTPMDFSEEGTTYTSTDQTYTSQATDSPSESAPTNPVAEDQNYTGTLSQRMIGELLERISQLKNESERLRKEKLSKHLESADSLLDTIVRVSQASLSEGYENLEELENRTKMLKLSLSARIEGLDDCSGACLTMTAELEGMKRELEQPLATTNQEAIHALSQIHHLYERLVETMVVRYDFYRTQVDNDISFEQQIGEELLRDAVAVQHLYILNTSRGFDELMKSITKERSTIELIMKFAEEEGDDSATTLNDIATAWDTANEKWKKLEAELRGIKIPPVNISQCWELFHWQEQWGPVSDELRDTVTTSQDRFDTTGKYLFGKIRHNLQLQLKKQAERVESMTPKTADVQDLAERVQRNQTLLGAVDTWQDLQQCQARVKETETLLAQNASIHDLGMDTEPEAPRLAELDRIDAHVKYVVACFVDEDWEKDQTYGKSYKEALINYEKSSQADDKAGRLREAAIELERSVYNGVQRYLAVHRDSRKNREFLETCMKIVGWASRRQTHIADTIDLDVRPGSNEYNDHELWSKQFRAIRNQISTPRRSSRLQQLLNIKVWVRVESGRCRPLMIEVDRKDLKVLGEQFTKGGFTLAVLRVTGSSCRLVPINFSVANQVVSGKEFVGLFACQGSIKWYDQYGAYLEQSENFSRVTWGNGDVPPWEKVDSRFDFNLTEAAGLAEGSDSSEL
ncbi:hypothetical protein TSTA_062140 [Talaromyces stipitatus ATCC 10500]|uniref:Uncharacterized protein n=1 Tax=Talaromyces stipitatus (strain ATCC 10500 / CBS 375.48 / QM 6759 / NRRL 1006) TaxID=441959 RepID=B8LX76_TALSN|nr:uncharacterized protein TSTA_062140 [Talaromyces stipitatus ATCC 10500]EED22726.1 hypothetical protein TSTA_062140 [Talaromyces stipitatus ATCC 10500]